MKNVYIWKNEVNSWNINVKIKLQENLEEYKTKILEYQKDNQASNSNEKILIFISIILNLKIYINNQKLIFN